MLIGVPWSTMCFTLIHATVGSISLHHSVCLITHGRVVRDLSIYYTRVQYIFSNQYYVKSKKVGYIKIT